MRRLALFLIPLLIALGALAYINRETLMLEVLAAGIEKTSLDERAALIAPTMEFTPPEGRAPPYPTVLLFHGCAGIRPPFMAQWAKTANQAGFMAVIVDSHGPRGIARAEALETVCKGKRLLGQERAGDVLAAYEMVRARSDVDAKKIVLAGWSHGAWSSMDLLALDPPKRWPAGIAPGDLAAPLDVAGVIGVYPYCGRGAWTRAIGWRKPVKMLMLLAGADTIVDPDECPALAKRLNGHGGDIEMHIYPEADHVFDDPSLEPEFQYLYNAEAHHDAERRVRAFLETIAAE